MKQIFTPGLTYDDVSLAPGHTNFSRADIQLTTRVSRNVRLEIPFVSAPMDTVTGKELALELGRIGGLGFIHRNQSVEDQTQQVTDVSGEGLQVGAAIGTWPADLERANALVLSGVTALLLDSAHGDTTFMLHAVEKLKKHHPQTDVIAGNIAETGAARRLIEAGADGLRVGMGPGAICTTRIVSGMGVPQITALRNVAKAATRYDIPFIADGGITYSGDLAKAIGAGASTIMFGRLFAGTTESLGELITLRTNQVPDRFKSILNPNVKAYDFKSYRGMGSIGAMNAGKALGDSAEFHDKDYRTDKLVAEGVEGYVPHTGTLKDTVSLLIEGLKSGMYYTGKRSIPKLQRGARFYLNTHASIRESHPHDMLVTNDGGNYQL
jgi:IMP dehydrogenase